MKIKFLLIALAATFNFLSAQAQWGESAKQVFASPKMKSEVGKHKLVDILPFSVSLT